MKGGDPTFFLLASFEGYHVRYRHSHVLSRPGTKGWVQ